jgi:succinate dehydrogenase / fumarate reductase flavoprotein subunit
LDIVVFGRRGGLAMSEYSSTHKRPELRENAEAASQGWIASLYDGAGSDSPAEIRKTLQDEMMDKASVVRTEESLSSVLDCLHALRQRYAKTRVKDRSKIFNTELTEHLELGFLLEMAEALVVSARARTESRGGHYREDHQLREDDHWLKHTFITKTGEGRHELSYKDVTMGRYIPVERKY